jgi:NAD(P)-dependent dehydrogenase (short-subunit alcohol dehydrogenase family)
MPPRAPHILITGGSKGIGLSTAHLFASHGYRCTLLSRSSDALKAAISSLPPLPPRHAAGPGHAYIAGDIKDPNFWNPRSTAPESFGARFPKPHYKDEAHASRIDVLVNCAGITQGKLFTAMTVGLYSLGNGVGVDVLMQWIGRGCTEHHGHESHVYDHWYKSIDSKWLLAW